MQRAQRHDGETLREPVDDKDKSKYPQTTRIERTTTRSA